MNRAPQPYTPDREINPLFWGDDRPVHPVAALAYVRKVANMLLEADRMGAKDDVPEGARFAEFSDTLLRTLAAGLRHVAEVLS